MKPSKFLLIAAAALMALAGCDKESGDTKKDNSGVTDGTDSKNAEAYVNLSETNLSLSKVGSTVSVTVESNYSWDYSYDSSNGWFTIEKDEKGSSLTISYDTNDTESDREGVVTVTAGDGADNIARAELKITQSWENFDALILEYTTTSNNTKIELPISGVSSVIIDWDDGNTETVSSNYPSHTYSTPGIYTITINGGVTHLNSTETNSSSTTRSGVKYLTAVKQWGDTNLTSMENAFRGCNNITSLPDDYVGAFKNVTTFEYAFYDCTALVSVPENMFSACTVVTTFHCCFYNCSSLTSAPSFKGLSAVTSFYFTFCGCTSLTTIPENIFSNCPNVTSFECCFYGCSALTTIPENIFSSFTALTMFSRCFENCSSLTIIPENIFSNCPNVTSFGQCFSRCSSLTTIPENIFLNCPNVTSFEQCFYDCGELTSIPVSLFNNCLNVTSFKGTFYNCSSVIGESPYSELEVDGEMVKVHLYERGNYAVEMRWPIPSGSDCFENSTFSDIDSIPSSWK